LNQLDSLHMPRRDISFNNKGIYHVFTKSIEGKKIFDINRYCRTFYEIACYYRSVESKVSLSAFKRLDKKIQLELLNKMGDPSTYKVSILAYCFMPNHFHFLIEQNISNGISSYVSNVLNSFTRYYNIANNRVGPLFLPKFKAVPVTHEDQLIHVSRYIHLNPYSSRVIKEQELLGSYRYSSYPFYVSSIPDKLVDNKRVIELFNYDKERYRKFIMDNAQHQQMLEACKHAYKWR